LWGKFLKIHQPFAIDPGKLLELQDDIAITTK
jgi:hypothetical protein